MALHLLGSPHCKLLADSDKPQLAKELAAPGAANSLFPKAPLIDDSKGPQDPIELAEVEQVSGAVRVNAQSVAEHDVALGGFCPVSFVKRDGLLVRADPQLGFIQ